MVSGGKPKLSLPPELGVIDDAWSQDEQPTIARPSRIPTAPARQDIPSEAPTAPGLDLDAPSPEAPAFELDLAKAEDEAEIQQRVTTVPEIPLDDFARRAMLSDSAAAHVTDAPRPNGALSTEAPTPEIDSEIPTRVPTMREMPTAAPQPAYGLNRRGEGHFPPASNPGVTLESLAPNISAPPLSDPRRDPIGFSGRFSSAPPDEKEADQRMKERFAMGDFSGALEVADRILRERPSNGDASSLAKRCREVLVDMYSSRLSGLHRVPQLVMGPDQIRWLSLDHRAGFLLSMIDGVSSIDELLDVSGMQKVDALRILCDLLDQKVISVS